MQNGMREGKQYPVKKIMGFLLALTLVLTVFNGFYSSADSSGAAKDISNLVEHKLYHFSVKRNGKFIKVIENGVKLENAPAIHQYDTVKLEYRWKISQENMRNVNQGDYFVINLPDQKIVKSPDAVADIVNPEGGIIGTFTVNSEGKLIATLSGDLTNTSEIRNGILGVFAQVLKLENGIPIGDGGGGSGSDTITIDVVPRPNPGDPSVPGPGPLKKEGYNKISPRKQIHKWGSYVEAGNYLSFTLTVNGDELEKIYKVNNTKTDSFKTRNNFYVVDELPEGLEFEQNSVGVAMPFWVPAYVKQSDDSYLLSQDTPSGRYVFNGDAYKKIVGNTVEALYVSSAAGAKKFMDFVESDSSKPWETFRDEIKAKPFPTIGVWNKTKLIIQFGTLPMAGVKYEDFFGSEEALKARIDHFVNKEKDSNRVISEEQAELVKKAYIGQDVVGFYVGFRTKISGKPKKNYTNTASAGYDGGASSQESKDVVVQTLHGSAEQAPFEGRITVKKKWFGTAKENAKVKVFAENHDQEYKATLTAPTWEHTFEHLPKYNKKNEEIRYQVMEEDVPAGYRNVVEKHETEYIYTVSNFELTELPVRKEWKKADGSPLTNYPNTPITVSLYRSVNGGSEEKVAGKSHTFNPSTDHWSYTFSGLDKTDDQGRTITYTAKEEVVPNGFVESGELKSGIFVITNTKGQGSFKVKKIWKNADDSNLTDVPAGDVSVTLYKKEGSSEVPVPGKTYALKASENWEHTFTGLDLVSDSGEAITYLAKEDQVPAGFAATGALSGDGYVLTNKKVSTDFRVRKDWKDEDGSALANPPVNQVTVSLYKQTVGGDVKVDGSTYILKESEGWAHTFTNLNKLENDGSLITYIAKEEGSYPNFATSGRMDADTYVITNKKMNGTFHVKKVWKNAAGEDLTEIPAGDLSVSLYKRTSSGDVKVAGQTYALKASENWEHTFTGLDLYETSSEAITYVAKEDRGVAGFVETGAMNGGTFVITNTKVATEITVKKLWKDLNNQDLAVIPAGDVSVSVYKKTTGGDVKVATYALKAAEGWSHTFRKLDKTDKDGVDLVYTVKEDTVPVGFVESVVQAGNSFEITNKREATKIIVKKEWKNYDGSMLTNPPTDKIMVSLYKTGTGITEEKVMSYELKSSESWTYEFKDLEKYAGDKLITYVVREDVVPQGYTLEVTNVAGLITLVNRQKPYIPIPIPNPPVIPTPTPDGPTPPPESTTPPTTITDNIPPVPPTPPIVPIVDDEDTPELDLDGDEDTPLGDTDLDVDEDENPEGGTEVKKIKKEKKDLAKTGGLDNKLFLSLASISVLLLLFAAVELFRRRNRK